MKNKIESLTLINGNNQFFDIDLPKIEIIGEFNDIALKHIYNNTGLEFIKSNNSYYAHPTESQQIVKLFLTYNFKTKYNNNAMFKNTLFLKSDHHIGYYVNSICYDCIKENNIHVNPDFSKNERLAC